MAAKEKKSMQHLPLTLILGPHPVVRVLCAGRSRWPIRQTRHDGQRRSTSASSAERKGKKCPDLASGHHRIMEPRKWGTRDDGFKQGQFRGVLLDSQHSSSSCAGVRCRWRIVGVVAVDMEIKRKRRAPGEKIPPFLYSAASGPPFAATPHRPTRLGLGRGEGPAEPSQQRPLTAGRALWVVGL